MIEEENKIKAVFAHEKAIIKDAHDAEELFSQSAWGSKQSDGSLQLSLLEALYLKEKGKLEVFYNKKPMSSEELIRRAREIDPNFSVRYQVFKDIRSRGYVCKTALKFGADFRVYDRGVKPGEDHARWIVYPVHESEQLTWYDFAAKNRVAHSTKKRLMMGLVDDEGDVTYYEIKWMRP